MNEEKFWTRVSKSSDCWEWVGWKHLGYGRFKKNKTAFEFFMSQPPGYRKVTIWWIVSAKKEETRLKRLEVLIEASARGKRLQ